MRQEYELLPVDDGRNASDKANIDDNEPDASLQTRQSRFSSVNVVTALILFLCTAVNFAVWYASRPNASLSPQSRFPSSSSERPSTYMGLDKLVYNATSESGRKFANFPFLLTQISSAEPERVWPDDSTQRLTSIGTVSPDSRRFVLGPDVSSVAQFRAIDYGYENCSLHFSVQASSKQLSPPGVLVNIWSLDMFSSRLDAARLSYSSRPPRKEKLGTVMLSPNTSVELQRTWRCQWGEFQTFEFECAKEVNGEVLNECEVDFWQGPRAPTRGVTLTQHSSLGN